MDREGASVLSEAIYRRVLVADSAKCAELKRKLERSEKNLRILAGENSYKNRKIDTLESFFEYDDDFTKCPTCDNIIDKDERNELMSCDNCGKYEACKTWKEDYMHDDLEIDTCNWCGNQSCGECSSVCDMCDRTFCNGCLLVFCCTNKEACKSCATEWELNCEEHGNVADSGCPGWHDKD